MEYIILGHSLKIEEIENFYFLTLFSFEVATSFDDTLPIKITMFDGGMIGMN